MGSEEGEGGGEEKWEGNRDKTWCDGPHHPSKDPSPSALAGTKK